MTIDRLAPMEKAVLGAMLWDSKAFTVTAQLKPEDFVLDAHRRLLTVMRQMASNGLDLNELTLIAEIQRQKLVEAVGGLGALADLGSDRGFVSDLPGYIREIKTESGRRKLIALCEFAKARAENGEDPDEVYAELQTRAVEAQSSSVQISASHISELVLPTWSEIERQRAHTGDVLGIPTGLRSFDEATTGWRGGELSYIGASPGMGKTSFMLQAMHYAASKGFVVGCISLEMRKSQLVKRLATIQSGIKAYKMRDPRELREAEVAHLKQSLYALGDLPIYICDQSGLKPSQISALARQMHSKGAKIIFVDFVQIVAEDGRDRREAINRVSASLRDTCKSLEIPFVVLSQLARRSDPNAPPKLSDLRESGNLEQDAHNVAMLHRPKANGQYTGEDLILLEKQREGVTGPLPVHYDSNSLTFIERTERAA